MNYIECIRKVYENNKDKNVIVDKDGKRLITYNTLDIFSSRISDKLDKSGVKKGDREQTDENKVKIVERRKKEAFSREYEEFIGTLTKALNEELWNEVELIKDDNVATSDFFEIFETLNAEKK